MGPGRALFPPDQERVNKNYNRDLEKISQHKEEENRSEEKFIIQEMIL